MFIRSGISYNLSSFIKIRQLRGNKSNRFAYQSVNPSTSSGLILKATNSKAVSPADVVHVGTAAVEVEEA